jgi:hypothetical protein
MEYIGLVIGPLLVQLPLLITLGVGIVLAALRWNRHPQVSKWAITGFGGMMFNVIVFGALSPFVVASLSRSGESATAIGATMAVISIAGGLLGVIWWGCILAAVFGSRNKTI